MSECEQVHLEGVLLPGNEASHGRVRIAGTGLTVHDIAVFFREPHSMSAERIIFEMAPIPAAGVHAAIAYYLANREEVDQDLADNLAWAMEWEATHETLKPRHLQNV